MNILIILFRVISSSISMVHTYTLYVYNVLIHYILISYAEYN